MSEAPRVLVVGGGLAGLTAAYRLLHGHDAGDDTASPPLRHAAASSADQPRVVIAEADTRLGGRIVTERFDGFVVDAGADSFLGTRPHILPLLRRLGLEAALQGTQPARRRSCIRRDNKLFPLPEGMSGVVPASPDAWLGARVLSWPGRLRAALDLVLPRGAPTGDESVAAFARRRFGREASEWLIEPLLGGIHGGSGENLSIRATFPALVEAEQRAGSVLRGLRLARNRGGAATAHPLGAFLTLRGGMGRLIDALSAALTDCDVRAGEAVQSLDLADDGWYARTIRGATICADAVVLALPAHTAAGMLRDVAPGLAALLAGVQFGSAAVLHLAFDRDALRALPPGHGYLNGRGEGVRVTACTWTSQKFADRAPAEAFLMRAFLSGDGVADIAEPDALRLVRAELRAASGIGSSPRWHRLYRFPHAMPQYSPGHLERVAAVEQQAAALPGLFLAGSSYHGVGIPDTIGSATRAAAAVQSWIENRRLQSV